jgi:ubiquinone/menaquinone biosynthesis C-methylase UbiE
MSEEKRDKHFPLWSLDNPIRRLYENPNRYCSYVTKGQVVADLGCGPGYYTLALAESVGPEGRVYAVDSDEKTIRALEKKADKRGYHNIEAHATSASDLSFIKDGSVDFILAGGLLCSMAPRYRESAVNEMRRILKPKGMAYLSAARGTWSYIERAEWEKILEGFRVERRGGDGFNVLAFVALADRWAVVSVK